MAAGAAMGSRGSPIPPHVFEGRFGIKATLEVHLVGGFEEHDARGGVMGWVEGHIERKTESLGTLVFLQNAEDFLRQAGMSHVSVVKIGDYEVYLSSDRTLGDNWTEAFAASRNSDRAKKQTNSVWILVHGKSAGFEFEQDVTFNPVHPLSQAAVRMEVLAVPVEWGNGVWDGGIRRILQDKRAVALEESKLRPEIEKYLQNYQVLLRSSLLIENISSNLRVNLSDVDPGAFNATAP